MSFSLTPGILWQFDSTAIQLADEKVFVSFAGSGFEGLGVLNLNQAEVLGKFYTDDITKTVVDGDSAWVHYDPASATGIRFSEFSLGSAPFGSLQNPLPDNSTINLPLEFEQVFPGSKAAGEDYMFFVDGTAGSLDIYGATETEAISGAPRFLGTDTTGLTIFFNVGPYYFSTRNASTSSTNPRIFMYVFDFYQNAAGFGDARTWFEIPHQPYFSGSHRHKTTYLGIINGVAYLVVETIRNEQETTFPFDLNRSWALDLVTVDVSDPLNPFVLGQANLIPLVTNSQGIIRSFVDGGVDTTSDGLILVSCTTSSASTYSARTYVFSGNINNFLYQAATPDFGLPFVTDNDIVLFHNPQNESFDLYTFDSQESKFLTSFSPQIFDPAATQLTPLYRNASEFTNLVYEPVAPPEFTEATLAVYNNRFNIINANDMRELQTGPSISDTGTGFVTISDIAYVSDNSGSSKRILAFDMGAVNGASTGSFTETTSYNLGAISNISVSKAYTGHLLVNNSLGSYFFEIFTGSLTPLSTRADLYYGGYIFRLGTSGFEKRQYDTGSLLDSVTLPNPPTSGIDNPGSGSSGVVYHIGNHAYVTRSITGDGITSPIGGGGNNRHTQRIAIYKVNLDTLAIVGSITVSGSSSTSVSLSSVRQDSFGRAYVVYCLSDRSGSLGPISSFVQALSSNMGTIGFYALGTGISNLGADMTSNNELILSLEQTRSSEPEPTKLLKLSLDTQSNIVVTERADNNFTTMGPVNSLRREFDPVLPIDSPGPEVALGAYSATFIGESFVGGYECFAALRFNTDGTVEKLRGSNQAIATWQPEGTWAQNLSAGDSDSYWINFVPSQGNIAGLSGSGTPLNTWYQMNTPRVVKIDATSPEIPPAGFLPSTATVGTVQIATDSLGSNIVASGAYTVWTYFETGQ